MSAVPAVPPARALVRVTLRVVLPCVLGVPFAAACVGEAKEGPPRYAAGAAEKDAPTPAARARDRAPAPPPAEVTAALAARLDGEGRPPGLRPHDWAHVRRLYERGVHGQPGEGGDAEHTTLWLDGTRLRPRAEWLIAALADAHAKSFRVDGYPFAELRAALEPLADSSGTRAATPAELAHADLMLTALYVTGAEDLLVGQVDPRTVAPDWHIPTRETTIDSALARGVDATSLDSAMAALRPARPEYMTLLDELARYRGIVAAGGWPKQPAGPKLRPRDTTTVERLTTLRDRLKAEGYPVDSAAITPLGDNWNPPARAIYGGALAGALATFQLRHGLTPDSILGPGTRGVLDVSAEYRLRQIAANIERHRWLPRALGDRYVLVNVPEFRLEAYDGGQLAMTMRVVVGSGFQDRATPTFADSMATVVFRPYWNVTPAIAAGEIWPKVRKDSTFLAKHDYEVVTEYGTTRVRQKPGPKNSLGLVKFLFPNNFNIYLHDTPADDLFGRTVRNFSHGCIRLEHPARMAEFVLGTQGWDSTRVRAAMETGKDDQTVRLKKKLPVYIVYFTTFVRDGALHFGPDIYEHDAKLTAAVAQAAMPDGNAVREAALLRELVKVLAKVE